MLKAKLKAAYDYVGLPCIIIACFLLIMFICLPILDMNVQEILNSCINRIGMNWVLALALMPPMIAGIGINFGQSLGIVCGLLGGMLSIEWGLTGWLGFAVAIAISVPFATLFGTGYGAVLNKVKGSEATISTYVGFSVVALMSALWLLFPVQSEAVRWPMGNGVRAILTLAGSYESILDNALAIRVTEQITLPIGTFVFCALLSFAMYLFSRSRTGIILKTSGMNPRFASAIGIDNNRSRRISIILSTVLSAVGIIVHAQSYGFYQFYEAPLTMVYAYAAAILIGGANGTRATVFNVVLGTILFQSMLTVASPLGNRLLPESTLSEVLRILISYGVILYAMTKAGKKK